MGLAMEKQIITGNQWIAHCDPTKSITELLIPGTHDTMTADCEARYYRTQTLSLQQQLQIGVRFLDIRLRKEMVAAHREWISNISAEQIFEKCGRFLQQNPQEFILMRIQNANEHKDDFPQYGEALIDKIRSFSSLFYQWEETENRVDTPFWPIIKQAAGKIIALECSPPVMNFKQFDNKIWAANWHDNPYIELQDLWDAPPLEEKELAISELIAQSVYLPQRHLILNHISATNGELGFPDAYANHLNPYTAQLWQQAPKGIRGVQIYDFITENLSRQLLELNFR